jgi:hypothetical protein
MDKGQKGDSAAPETFYATRNKMAHAPPLKLVVRSVDALDGEVKHPASLVLRLLEGCEPPDVN